MSELSDKEKALRAFINWAVYSANWVGEKYGEEGVEEYYRYLLEKIGSKLFERDGPEILKALQTLDTILGSETVYEEDDEKVVLTVRCNTGGRAEREGKSMSGPSNGSEPAASTITRPGNGASGLWLDSPANSPGCWDAKEVSPD